MCHVRYVHVRYAHVCVYVYACACAFFLVAVVMVGLLLINFCFSCTFLRSDTVWN